MINCLVENVETYAMLNYLRDKVMCGFDLDESFKWEIVKDEFIVEAENTIGEYVLTSEEVLEIIRRVEQHGRF